MQLLSDCRENTKVVHLVGSRTDEDVEIRMGGHMDSQYVTISFLLNVQMES